MSRVAVTKLFEFEACHHLPNYEGACARLHGHSYKLEVTITNFNNGGIGVPEESGFIMDFSELKRIVKDTIIDHVDHVDLNTLYPNPTAEIMIRDFYNKLVVAFPPNISIVELKLWETSTSYASIS